jgi:RluA family pseudouridine synthase
MATRRLTWRIGAAQQGMRLDRFLAAALAEAVGLAVPRAQVDWLLQRGRVQCDGRPERHGSSTLQAGNRVDAAFDPETLGADRSARTPQSQTADTQTAFAWTPERILFEDEWLVVVDKPAGLPTQPTLDASRPSVFGTLKDFLARRDGGEIYLGLHHRLDRDTTGVLLFTKDRRANAATAALFSGKTAQKTYQALAAEKPGAACPDSWRVANYLGAVGRVGKATKFGAVRSGGDPAQTSFRLLERLPGALLVEAQPHTGRTHQIRVHLAEGGTPIYGDTFYGGPPQLQTLAGGGVPVSRVMLHAARLEFLHPVTGVAMVVTSLPPADFAECRSRLRASP